MKTLRICQVYFHSKGVYILGFSNTPYGLIANTPSVQLPVGSPAEALGIALLDVLQSLKSEIVEVDLLKAGKEYQAHLKSLGFKSINAFEKRARTVSVELDNGIVKVVPYESAEQGGFLPLTAQAKTCGVDAKEVGDLVLKQKAAVGD